ncbi:MAG: GH1 family beta-glucosidase [Myxococcales bacterium]
MSAPMTSHSRPLGVSRRRFLGASAVGAGTAAAAASAGRPATAAGLAGSAGAPFPKDFLWGAATSAYQIEGAAAEEGRGPSVWDVFSKKKGATFEGQTGDIACDHYHRYKEDVALMKGLGLKSYRFSISWSRVLPEGVGAVNPKGFDFYNRLVDELLANGIAPFCTLFHWDYPQALYKRGGWLNRDSADWFAEYAALVAQKLSDRVKMWATLNEVPLFVGHGHLEGAHAPGDKLAFSDYLLVGHNAMRAHGKAVLALRANIKGPAAASKVGSAMWTRVNQPATDRPQDIKAAAQAMFATADRSQWQNSWWSDPMLLGKYPEDGLALYGKDVPKFKAGDLDGMKQPLDFLGLNIYRADPTRQGADGKPEVLPVPPGQPRSGVDWQVITPACLYWGPRFFHERYQLPIAITENGLSTRDQVFLDGKVHDPQRIDYTHRVLLELSRAMKDGIPVFAYYAWSLMDNFEWADGFKQRFGLVYVDFQTQKRLPKDSYHWYKKVIATGGKNLLVKGLLPAAQVTPTP